MNEDRYMVQKWNEFIAAYGGRNVPPSHKSAVADVVGVRRRTRRMFGRRWLAGVSLGGLAPFLQAGPSWRLFCAFPAAADVCSGCCQFLRL